MNFELSLILIQTITGLFSLYLGYKAIDLNQKSYKNSNDCYINTGIHNQTYIENTSTKYNEIIEKKERYLKYFHWTFNFAFFGTGIYTFIKMFPELLIEIKIFDGGITLTNLTKLLTLSLQNALLGSLIINLIGGLLLIIFTILRPYYSKRRIPLSIIIIVTNLLIFIDLLINKYHNNIINSIHGDNNVVNLLTVFFIFITMMLVLANNMILGIYLFDLISYKNQFKDPIVRFSTIIVTAIIYISSKWIAFYGGLEVIKEYVANYFN
ncbi:hypothetical protein GC005_12880 [Staphylococcus pseudintermedius]|nr:hypothetical protein [Staphylococcus pseudintermedius]